MKIGFIQSRGLGDLIIALPIAREYSKQGYEVHWPVCEPFYQQMMQVAPWVTWYSVPVDDRGNFFYTTPHSILEANGVEEELWLYQYLSSHPDRTNKSHFAQFKFDQYKYAAAGVPFSKKWTLSECITRDPAVEERLYSEVVKQDRYMVYQGVASDLSYDIDLSIVDPAVQCIELEALEGYSVFDWLKVIEGAETIILIDSVFANLIDQLDLNPAADKYYMRKWNRRVDGNPVLMGNWTYVDIEDPANMQVQSLADVGLNKAKDPAVQTKPTNPNPSNQSAGQTYTPFGQGAGVMPTSFLNSTKKPNTAQSLLNSLGLKQ
jgi:hypothetical protein